MLDVSAVADAIRAQYPDLSITFTNSKTLTVQWDDGVCSRAEWLQTIAQQLPNAEYVAASTRSSVGHVRVDGFTVLAKPASGAHPLTHETAAIYTLHTAIRSYIATTSTPPTIVLPIRNSPTSNIVYTFTNVVAAEKVMHVPKADCVLLDVTDTPVCWLSLKAGNGPEAFQQYAGISPSADGNTVHGCISTDPEVLAFIKDLAPRHSLIVQGRQRFYRAIESPQLIARAVFGPAYESDYGEDHVHAIGQGIPHLIPRQDDTTALCFSGACILSGDVAHFQVGAYQAVLGARYQGRRRFVVDGQQYRDVRVGIMPKRLIATARASVLPPETPQ